MAHSNLHLPNPPKFRQMFGLVALAQGVVICITILTDIYSRRLSIDPSTKVFITITAWINWIVISSAAKVNMVHNKYDRNKNLLSVVSFMVFSAFTDLLPKTPNNISLINTLFIGQWIIIDCFDGIYCGIKNSLHSPK